jgi:hypothetical protein
MVRGLLKSACLYAVVQEQCQELSAQLSAAQERAACLTAVCTQLDRQVTALLPPGASCNQWAAAPEYVAVAPAHATASPQAQSCMAALAQSLQQRQLQQQRFRQEQPEAAAQQYNCCSPPGACTQPLQAYEPLYPPQQSPMPGHSCCQMQSPIKPAGAEGNWASPKPWSQHRSAAEPAARGQHQPCVTPVKHAQCCSCGHRTPVSPATCHDLRNSHTCRQQAHALSRSPGFAAVAAGQPQPLSAAGLVSQLQAGVTRLQQQLGASQQQLMQKGALSSPQHSR